MEGTSPPAHWACCPMIGGIALAGIGKVWGVTSATSIAVQHNRSLSPTLEIAPTGRVFAGVKVRIC